VVFPLTIIILKINYLNYKKTWNKNRMPINAKKANNIITIMVAINSDLPDELKLIPSIINPTAIVTIKNNKDIIKPKK
jgi:hypothetical protein